MRLPGGAVVRDVKAAPGVRPSYGHGDCWAAFAKVSTALAMQLDIIFRFIGSLSRSSSSLLTMTPASNRTAGVGIPHIRGKRPGDCIRPPQSRRHHRANAQERRRRDVAMRQRQAATDRGLGRRRHHHSNYKNKIVEIDEEGTTIMRCHTGKPCRLVRNQFTESWVGREAQIEPFPIQSDELRLSAGREGRYEGKVEEGGLACGSERRTHRYDRTRGQNRPRYD